MSIQRAILIAFIVLTLISASLMTGLAYYRSRQALENEIRRNIDAQALSAIQQIDTLVFERLVNLYGWSQLEVMQDIKVGDVDKRLSRFLHNMGEAYAGLYLDLIVADEQKIVAASRAGEIGQRWRVRPGWLQLSIEDVVIAIERPETLDQRPFMEMHATIRDLFTDKPLGQLAVRFNWNKIVDVLNTAVQSTGREDTGRVGLLVDGNGNILAVSDSYKQAKVPHVSDYVGVTAQSQDRDKGRGSFGQKRMLTGSASMERQVDQNANQWKVVIIDPLDQAFKPIRKLLASLLLLLLSTMAVAAFVATRLARTIARPVRDLTRLARKIPDQTEVALGAVKGFSETNELAETFDRMLEALDLSRKRLVQMSTLAAVGEMSAMLAHEIRNPLGILRSSAQLMGRRKDLDDRDREMLGYIISESDRINDLVTNLMEKARPKDPVIRTQDLAPIVEHVIGLLESRVQKKQIELNFKKPTAPMIVNCDRDQMIQVLFNLIINAIQIFPGQGGWISVRLYKDEHLICVDVDDNGPGVPEEQRGEILEPFVSNRKGGMGLGLSIVFEILTTHGGKLKVSESADHGARFTVCLPEGGVHER